MKIEQVNAILAALGEIRDRLDAALARTTVVGPTSAAFNPGLFSYPPAPLVTIPQEQTYFVDAHFPDPPIEAPSNPVVVPEVPERTAARREALRAVLDALDATIDRTRDHHEKAGGFHRGEPADAECWRSYHPAEIRVIVNDAAANLGMKPFVPPRDPMEYRP